MIRVDVFDRRPVVMAARPRCPAAGLEPGPQHLAADVLAREIVSVVASAHELDEAHGDGPGADEIGEPRKLGRPGGVLQQDGVDLHRRHTELQRPVQARHHGRQAVMAGDPVEHLAVERVDADVEVGQAAGAPVIDVPRQVPAVGGDGGLVDSGCRAHAADDFADVAAHRRLSAGQADLAHAELREDVNQPPDLGHGQERGGLGLLVAVRQAVGAAEVAHLGDREPQVLEPAAETVDEAGHGGGLAGIAPDIGRRGRATLILLKGLDAHQLASRGRTSIGP